LNVLLDEAGRVAGDPSIGLSLIHRLVPHAPVLYNRKMGRIAPAGNNSYIDSIALADQVLARLRRSMEEQNVWDKTAVIVSADHGWRPDLWRGGPEWTSEDASLPSDGTLGVPFFVKMPEQVAPVVYSRPFDTVVTRAVITAILERKLSDASQLPEIIEQQTVQATSAGAK